MRRRLTSCRRAVAAAALLFLGVPPCLAQTPSAAPPPAEAAALRAAAERLAHLVQPREMIVEEAMRVLDAQFVTQLRALADLSAMEAAYPGLLDAMYQGVRPELLVMLEGSLPGLWNLLTTMYAEKLTLAEIEAAAAFYGSPLGQKVVRLMNSRIDIAPIAQDVLESEAGAISEEGYRQMLAGAGEETVRQLTPAERVALLKFTVSPAGSKLRALAPQAQTLAVEWMNKTDPATDARIEAAMLAAMERHITAHEARGGAQ